MSAILVTGATGFLGGYLTRHLLENHQVYALLRDPRKCPEGCLPLRGDITKRDLGLEEMTDFDEIYNLAGSINLSKRARKQNFRVNVQGAYNVAHFALRHKLKRLIHVSSAYASDRPRNPYEESKWLGEQHILEAAGEIPTIIFKPSILVGEYETGTVPDGVKPGAFYEFIAKLLRIHGRVDSIRKGVESKLHLWPWTFGFHIPGDPEAALNLIPVDTAARAMAEMAVANETGTFYITNPSPPKLKDLAEWVGEAVRLRIRIEPEPSLYPWDIALTKVASDFLPYLRGEEFGSDLGSCPPIDRDFISRTLKELAIAPR